MSPAVFDEAQYQVFKELLPFWAGFMKKYESPEDEKRPSEYKHIILQSGFLLFYS